MAGLIPQTFIDDLLQRIDIVDIIDERVPLRKAGNSYKACCPFHNEKTPSFHVNQDKQFYHCFGCGANGSALGFLMEYDNLGFVDAVHDLASRAGMEVPTEGDSRPANDYTADYELLSQVSAYYQKMLKSGEGSQQAIDYLKGRGLSGEIAASYELGYAPAGWDRLLKQFGKTEQSRQALYRTGMLIEKDQGGHYDRFRERIMFPIRDPRGRVIGFGGRIIGQGEPKYLNSPETPIFHKGRELYGLYQAKKAIRDKAQIIVVEGYMDVVALAQFGVDNAVATLGTATTREHLDKLFRLSPEILFCFDGDRAGRQAAWRALETSLPLLVDGRSILFLFMPEGEDPDTMVRSKGSAVFTDRQSQTALSDFLFATQEAQIANLDSDEGRARLFATIKPLIEQLPTGTYRDLLLKRLSERTSLTQGRLASQIGSAPDQQPNRQHQLKPQAGHHQMSLVRLAIKLLLTRPEIAHKAEDVEPLRTLDLPGIELMVDLIQFIQQRPGSHMGMILQHWQGDENGKHLSRLLAMEALDLENGEENEFLDTLHRLRMQHQAQRLSILTEKAEKGMKNLSDAEKTEYRQLLARQAPS